MKLTTTLLFGLVVCFTVVNGKYRDYTEPTYPPEEETPTGPVEESAGPEETGGEDVEEGGEARAGKGGEETGVEMKEKPPKEHPEGAMGGDTDAAEHKGNCHWHVGVWIKPGISQRCGCLRCMCKPGGAWDCKYNFAYCPYYYCGNLIYNPESQLCCCGKVYEKRSHHSCCGYQYMDIRHSKCCNYYSIRPIKSHCPRDRV